ncbi:hypothetical protein Btru_008640 [Bulinus truncatus]|nr:hypothetical protein Btru_008640 [Bulinus truncatus]
MVLSSFSVCLCLLLAQPVSVSGYRDCYNVLTSEGARTVHHGERVCAALQNGETESDIGRSVLFCSNGVLTAEKCGSTLSDSQFNHNNAPVTTTYKPPTTTKSPPTTTLRLRPTTQTSTTTTQKTTTTTQPSTDTTQTSTDTTQTSTDTTQTSITKTQKSISSPHTPPDGPCSPLNCQLPDCFCYGGQPDIPAQDTPQFVMVTFDDAVTPQFYQNFYRDLLVDNTYKLFNPSGCPISGAFYVSHDNTDYSKVMKLWQAGNEIASHTIHHILPDGIDDSDYTVAASEIDGLRQEIFKALGNRTLMDSVSGFRAPYLKVAHNVQFDVLRDYDFLYDTSVTSDEIWTGETPLWPFTLDFLIKRLKVNATKNLIEPYMDFFLIPAGKFEQF